MGIDENIREIQKGILKWYPFHEGTECLYVGEETDAVYEMLTDHDDRFLIKDLKVTICPPADIKKCASMFDYIVSVASLETLPDMSETLQILSRMLKPEGHLLLGANNRLGIRYFFGDRDIYTNNIFDGLEDYRRAYNKAEDTFYGRCYDKKTLMDVMDEIGLRHQNYSVFPDLNNAQIIIRDDYESNEDYSIRVIPTFHHAETVFLEEEYIYNSLQKNGMLHTMANAFLFDCRFSDEKLDVLQVTSSMGRAKEDAFFTMIREDQTVEKVPAYEAGIKKTENMLRIMGDLRARGIAVIDMERRDNGSVVMPFIDAPTAQVYLSELAMKNMDLFLEKMDEFVGLILKSSHHIREDNGDGEGVILEKGYPDMVPLNCFYTEKGFAFFDQEFEVPEYPANVAIYISCCAMGAVLGRSETDICMDDLYKRYGLEKKLDKWQTLHWDFIGKLRKEKELAPYFSKVRRDTNQTYSNRLRMNYSAEEYMKKFVNIFHDLDRKKVLLFGSGNFAKQFMQMYGEDYNVEAVIDNRMEKQGQAFYGVPICGPEVLKDYKAGEFRVIVCIKNFLSVTNQLENLGIRDYGIFDPSQKYVRERRNTRNNEAASASDETVETAKPKKYHTGYIAGVFDLFHVGHLEKFKLAKEQCDHLIVGLVTDEGVRLYKKTEPFVPFEDRKAMLEACKYVDEVVKIPPNFGGTRDAWRMYGFDVQFSGSDYQDDPAWQAEKEFLEAHGVAMVFFPYTESTSSSKLKELIEKKLL